VVEVSGARQPNEPNGRHLFDDGIRIGSFGAMVAPNEPKVGSGWATDVLTKRSQRSDAFRNRWLETL
jgi:hypothetical protein